MSLHYQHDLKLEEIGEVLHVSGSRVCQLLRSARARLRISLREWRP